MKLKMLGKITLSVMLACAFSFAAVSQTKTLRTMENKAFKKGEVLNFRVHYGFVNAGSATIEVKKEEKKIGSRDVFHIVGIGKSNETFDLFFKVRSRYDTYLDQQAIIPWLFLRNIEEGKYRCHQNVVFYQYQDKAKSEKAEITTPDNVQDLLSTYFYARCLDYSNAKVGDIFTLNTYLDDEINTFSYKYLGKETIKTEIGTIRCLKFCPTLLKGRVFKNEDDMTVWISDDENKLPIRAEAEVIVGTVKMDLSSYSGLANPLAIVKK